MDLHLTSRRTARLAGLLASSALLLAACGSQGSDSSSSTSPSGSGYGSAPKAKTSAGVAALQAHQGSLGTFLVDGKQRPVYLFERDKSTTSRCAGACAAAWPPLVTASKPTAGTGVRANLLGTTKRSDGSEQVTYAGHPLYRYSGDSQPGAPSGQGSQAFGAPWYVVRPSGAKLDSD